MTFESFINENAIISCLFCDFVEDHYVFECDLSEK